LSDPEKLVYSAYVIGGVASLLVALAIYMKFTRFQEKN
jgi:hypothetical protein